jgi:DNA topoisomerase IB
VEAEANVTAALERVAARLGNTPAGCKKAYVHPAVLEIYVECRQLPRNASKAPSPAAAS